MTTAIENPVAILQRPKPADVRPPGFLADTWNVMVRELRPVFREHGRSRRGHAGS